MLYGMNTIADRIKRLRKHLGVTQEKLGEFAGITKSAVSQWERGITEPQWEALLTLQRTKRVNPEWVQHGVEPMILPGQQRPPMTNEEAEAQATAHMSRIEVHSEEVFIEDLSCLLDRISSWIAPVEDDAREDVDRLILRYLHMPQEDRRREHLARAIGELLQSSYALMPLKNNEKINRC
ncbi:MAG: helix-turn-helix domain-containing protein [Sphingobacterium sp.]|nr:helix-turn-helix domain-containing protein [Sphingobacterium sp.]